MNATKIEWADRVWNPVTGCSEISPGCDHCYARRMSRRLAGRIGEAVKAVMEGKHVRALNGLDALERVAQGVIRDINEFRAVHSTTEEPTND